MSNKAAIFLLSTIWAIALQSQTLRRPIAAPYIGTGAYSVNHIDVFSFTSNQASLAWRYTTGTVSGSVPVTIPAALPSGTYELRLFSNNGYTPLAVSNSFTVTGCTGISLSASPASVPAGGSVTGTWGGICAPTGTDWIGLYLPGAPNQPSLAWRYTTGTASGGVPVTIPATLTPGTYELRLFSNNGYTRLGTSGTFAVTSP